MALPVPATLLGLITLLPGCNTHLPLHTFLTSDKYKKSQRTAAGADKWLDTRLWGSTADCLGGLKAAGYQIITTHLSASSITIQVTLGRNMLLAAAAQFERVRQGVARAGAMGCSNRVLACLPAFYGKESSLMLLAEFKSTC